MVRHLFHLCGHITLRIIRDHHGTSAWAQVPVIEFDEYVEIVKGQKVEAWPIVSHQPFYKQRRESQLNGIKRRNSPTSK